METKTIVGALMDAYYVTDYANDYGEPGYRLPEETGLVLLGDWWCHCDHGSDKARAEETAERNGYDKPHYLHGVEEHYPRMFRALEERGCALEWNDEWTVIYDHQGTYGAVGDSLAFRTEPDSYSWEATAVLDPDSCEYLLCGEDLDAWLSFAVNDPHRCLMSHCFTDSELESAGFVERQCDYENGWYGVSDDPEAIMEAITEREDVDVLFKLAGVEQFRVRFCVYVRHHGFEQWRDSEPATDDQSQWGQWWNAAMPGWSERLSAEQLADA